MEYQVPQFIEVEDRVVGPLTLKQFIYLGGGVGLCAVALIYLPLVFGLLVALPIGGLAVALAFYKVNGKPLVEIMEHAVGFYTGSKLFLWKHEDPKQPVAQKLETPVPLPGGEVKLTRGKLRDLAWSLDIQNRSGEVDSQQPQ